MPHPDPDDLALLALGESLGSAVDAHVAGCAACTAEIESFKNDGRSRGAEQLRRERAATRRARLGGHRGRTRFQRHAVRRGDAERSATAGRNAAPADRTPSAESRPADRARRGTDGDAAAPTPTLAASDAATAPCDRIRGPSPGTGRAGRERQAAAAGGGGPAGRRRWPPRWSASRIGAGAVIVSQNRSDDVTVEAVAPLTPVPGGPLTADQQEPAGQGRTGRRTHRPGGQGERSRPAAVDQLLLRGLVVRRRREDGVAGHPGRRQRHRSPSRRASTPGSTGWWTSPTSHRTAIRLHSGISLIRGAFS